MMEKKNIPPVSFIDKLKKSLGSKSSTLKDQRATVDWLKAQLQDFAIYSARKVNSNTLFKDKDYKKIKVPQPGDMIMYWYDAKGKETLPFWDMFPLGIFIGPTPNDDRAFYSLNVHYLEPMIRAKFFDVLLDTLTTKKINDSSRIAVTYDLLKSSSKYKYFKPAFKKYLIAHVSSPIKVVPPEQWVRILFLETAQWQSAGKQTVYKWSRNQF